MPVLCPMPKKAKPNRTFVVLKPVKTTQNNRSSDWSERRFSSAPLDLLANSLFAHVRNGISIPPDHERTEFGRTALGTCHLVCSLRNAAYRVLKGLKSFSRNLDIFHSCDSTKCSKTRRQSFSNFYFWGSRQVQPLRLAHSLKAGKASRQVRN